MSFRGNALRRALLACAATCFVWLVVLAITGPVLVRPRAISLNPRTPWTPTLCLAIAAGALLARKDRSAVVLDLASAWDALDRRAALVGAVAAAAAVIVGIVLGTHAAGGSDSYCYISQADLFASGRVSIDQSFTRSMPWPDAPSTFVPVGWVASSPGSSTIVPMCPPGLPLLMAAVEKLSSRTAVHLVVPILGGLAVWLTFLLGRWLGGGATGVMSAILLLVSPIFLYQVVQPMTDVAATGWWLAAVVLAVRVRASERPHLISVACGVAAGWAVLTRPNLLPLAVVIMATMVVTRRDSVRRIAVKLAAFGCGFVPFCLVVAWVQHAMYGSPMQSGYGQLNEIYQVSRAGANLLRYPAWLIESETPLILLAVTTPLLVWRDKDRRAVALLWLLFSAVNLLCYVFYTPFDDWSYLRFLLPSIPLLLILMAMTAVSLVRRAPLPMRTPLFVIACSLLAAGSLTRASAHSAFELQRLESRFSATGREIVARLPSNAILLTVHHSGSIRYASGRQTVIWDALAPSLLDAAISGLSERRLHPYIVIERWEEETFRARFVGHSAAGVLDWPPVLQIGREVRIYDPADRARYFSGGSVHTERVFLAGDAGREGGR